MTSTITTCLWFNNKEAEEAAAYYVSIFNGAPGASSHPASTNLSTTRYTSAGEECHRQEPGSTMTAEFTLRGQRFVGLNGGPQGWSFSPAVSFQIDCADQEEVDYFWGRLGEGGDEKKQQCGWLQDKFGISWQVVPVELKELIGGGGEGAARVTSVMMGQKKLDIGALRKALEG
ncbi:related to 3-demethylubiquinone-9 3-methyltransferase [Cephalotrichum gorgonifer]|uniref:Related to 3-demethylubiquinone-9 3-methyltransferase n=1 Tax=Cephalotrichum gorgonifer TaxID=2041049 RepID=A0AAE8N4Y1_9PEZI|nr:related to 3-demethylubiquinone-9 3-methyltransferase [Cephalotrichum gorgonifer]